MYRILLPVFVVASVILGCTTPAEKGVSSQQKEQVTDQAEIDTILVDQNKFDSVINEIKSVPKVLIVPCANGYLYHMKAGVVNTSLEKYLAQDERVELLSFPYVAMNGAGYFGVYDKKHCKDILKHTDADFLVMTRMIGGLEPMVLEEQSDTEKRNWGYSTKILNREKMDQLKGISAKNLSVFEEIDSHVKRNVSVLVNSILTSQNSEP